MPIRDYANLAPTTAKFTTVPIKPCSYTNPIDHYLATVASISKSGTPDNISNISGLVGMLVVRSVSATENYFRMILSEMLEMCAVAQESCADQQIHLGGLIWHGKQRFTRSAFEHFSFSDGGEIRKATSKFIFYELPQASFTDILREYDRVCQVRHAIVHADGHLPGRNAVKLGVPSPSAESMLDLGYKELQEALLVCKTLVSTYNRELFDLYCKRWAIEWRKHSSWQPSQGKQRFYRVWRVFFSREELKLRSGKSRYTPALCMAEIEKTFNV